MNEQSSKATPVTTPDQQWNDIWSGLERPASMLDHAMRASALLRRPDDAESERAAEGDAPPAVASLLLDLLQLLGGERAFLLATNGEEAVTTGRVAANCLVAIDVDGESVQQPEKKIDPAITAAVVRSGYLASKEREPHLLALPIVGPRGVDAVIQVENRFRELHTDPDRLRVVRIQCDVIAGMLAQDRLQAENRSLWGDVARLREQPPTATATALEVPTPVRRGKQAQRSDLAGDYSIIVGNSPRMIEIFQILDRIATSNAPVLINGESGTGKELIANAVHRNSSRRDQPFISENCGALTETLLESELFGYMKGAFTGATKDSKGLFELATGGTLFLDEVGDMSPTMQKKLLRVLQENVVRRVGGKELIDVDVRIISATNKDLQEEVRQGNFREDLYYRLNVINLKLPPLRERREDVPDLVRHFLQVLDEEHGDHKEIDSRALEKLEEYDWPGNIRELQNEVKRLYALSDGEIGVDALSETILLRGSEQTTLAELKTNLVDLTLKQAVELVEEQIIRASLVECRGNKSLVAKKLAVPKTSLYNKINKYNLNR